MWVAIFFPTVFPPQHSPLINSDLTSVSPHPGTPVNHAPLPPSTSTPSTASIPSTTLLPPAQSFALASSTSSQAPGWSLGPGPSAAAPPPPSPQAQGTPSRANGSVNSAVASTTPHGNATPSRAMAPPGTPVASPSAANLGAPPEGIYRTFEDLLSAVQRVAKDNGYGIVKLRASNYRNAKPTRYDLVCDRGGVKYSSTAKKRNPSTRKVDCPFRAKAVCEVSLSNQWRFVVQDARHNHEARVPAAPPGQETTPVAQNLRSITNKLDRIGHDVSQGFQDLTVRFDKIIDKLEKRLETVEQRLNGVGALANAMPPNLGNGLGNSMTNGPNVIDSRLNNVEARLNAMETRSLEMPLDDVESRILSTGVL
ncbi:Transcription factor, FAR1-related protein [Niveomyces insectorum RCEF 264]|uniref:Transcription factor, FAR1-related protein n=1 Tax=Niveomyces insectorum RCEF 264 TaxID=1081102 RepID=A0A167U0D9_9HYPO|nr:Transcription factor, FAR1-related protein [Niveomyces insectorum RCEF 264]